MISAEAAYRRCEEITRSEARNFAYGIRLLPPPKRRAMSALYAMARRIDDVGDGDWPQDRKLAALDDLHHAVAALEAGEVADPADPVLVGVGRAAARYPIPVAALHEIVEGCELDVRGETYATMDDTVRYCRLVAGSVGRLALGVFGAGPARAVAAGLARGSTAPAGGGSAGAVAAGPVVGGSAGVVAAGPVRGSTAPAAGDRSVEDLADDLGVALQLTNMLRDIVEDHHMGRIYLPEQERIRFGIAPGRWDPPESAAALVQFVAGQAVTWFERGLVLLDHLDHRSRACTAAMAGIYRRLLARILAEPASPLNGRVSLPAHEKALVAARSLSGLGP
ncbi:MAG: squalene/phytoene synthase family protein [Gemmatimonadota bacterium]|nr:squalene/phytoene synthase family protein [Gemmatimonadota bacterium]